MPRRIPGGLQARVRQRAGELCEYCHTSERWQYVRFTIDHVVPVAEGGEDAFENLALACFHCNRRKSSRQTANDGETNRSVPLFNPRLHNWADHFVWSADGLYIIPRTPTGRVTVELLELNRERILDIRSADVNVKRHPPASDPVQTLDSPTA
jgi:HNH endonuclease